MRTLKNIWALMLKEFRSLFTDPVLLVLITFMFTGSIINTAKGISTDVKNATVGIIEGVLQGKDPSGLCDTVILP